MVWMQTSSTPLADEELMLLAGGGDHTAYAVIVQRHWTSALGVALRILHDRGLAEEVRQDAFLAAWLGRERFDAGRGSLRGWLLTIVRHRALDVRAGRRFAPSGGDGSGGSEWDPAGEEDATESEVLRRDEASRVLHLVHELPVDQAMAIELVFLNDLSRSEAAARLGVTSSAVKGRIRVGLEHVRWRLDAAPLGRQGRADGARPPAPPSRNA